MAKLLEVKDLATYFFTPEGVVKAVDGITYDLEEGEILGLVGESGCGKSVSALSLMRLIQNPGRNVAGSVMFNGQDLLTLDDDEMRHIRGKDMSMIFQEPMTSLNPVLTIGRQLTEALQLHLGLDKEAAENRAGELLLMVGIPEGDRRLRDYPHQFSGGMRQRVMIAMALSCNPKMLIADEPTTALDVTIQAQILELVQRLGRELGTAVLIITHNLGVVARYADRVNRDVRRQDHRAGHLPRDLRQSQAPLHHWTSRLGTSPGRASQGAAGPHRGPASRPDRPACGLRIPRQVQVRNRQVCNGDPSVGGSV